MNINEIKQQVKDGILKLEKTEWNTMITRRKYIYSKTKGSYVGKYKTFVPDIERIDEIKYPKVTYMALIREGEGYRISKKVYNELIK